MLADRVGHFRKPSAVFDQFHKIARGKEFDAVWGRIAEGLEQPGGDEDRKIMRLAIEHPCRLLDGEPRWKLSQERQEAMLLISHATPVEAPSRKRTGFSFENPQILLCSIEMTEHLIQLVRTYRLTPGLAERLRLAEEVFQIIEPQLRLFIFGTIRPPTAEDVFQEVLKAVAIGLGQFAGSSNAEFWGWCYRISRNKLNDHFRKASADRLQPMADEELWHLLEASAAHSPLSPEDKLDLEYAINLLNRASPECLEYLWSHFILGLTYGEIAEGQKLNYDNVRMRIGRCLDTARSLVAEAR